MRRFIAKNQPEIPRKTIETRTGHIFHLNAYTKKKEKYYVTNDPSVVMDKYGYKCCAKTFVPIHRIEYCKYHNTTPPTGWHIHHIDGNRFNNSGENLIALPAKMHLDLHKEHKKKDRNPLPPRLALELMVSAYCDKGWKPKAKKEKKKKRKKKYFDTYCQNIKRASNPKPKSKIKRSTRDKIRELNRELYEMYNNSMDK